MIVNLPGKIIEECGRNFMTHQAAFMYDTELLNQVFKFGTQKYIMTKQIDHKSDTEEKQEEIINNNDEQNLEELF
jgi:hypothetical protein